MKVCGKFGNNYATKIKNFQEHYRFESFLKILISWRPFLQRFIFAKKPAKIIFFLTYNFVQISYRFRTDFVQILNRFCTDLFFVRTNFVQLVPILYRFCTDFEQILYRFCTGFCTMKSRNKSQSSLQLIYSRQLVVSMLWETNYLAISLNR